MTVTTIAGGVPEFKRALENQNKPSTAKADEAKAQSSFPTDTITSNAAPVADLDEAIVQVRAQNLEASRSTLNESDLDAIAHQSSAQEKVQQQAVEATRAQTSKLPANILQLISE